MTIVARPLVASVENAKMREETREGVNELIKRRNEDNQFLEMRTLLKVAQRPNQTTRDQLDQARSEIAGQLQSQGDRLMAMEVGFAELNVWAENIADNTNTEGLWDTLMIQEGRIARLEEDQEEQEKDNSNGEDPWGGRVSDKVPPHACIDGPSISQVKKRWREEWNS